MKARLITSAILIPMVVLVILFAPPWLFTAVFFAVSVLLSWELLRFSKHMDAHVVAVNMASLALVYLAKYQGLFGAHPGLGELPAVSAILFFNCFAAAAIYIVYPRFEHALHNLALSMLALFYCGIVFSYAVDLRFLEVVRHHREGFESFLRGLFSAKPANQVGVLYIFYVLMVAWMYDTGAYFVGSALGKTNRIGLAASPNKSWAGLVGGMATVLLSALGFHFLCRALWPEAYDYTVFAKSLPLMLALTAVLGLLTQVGDLIESVFKRSAGVKDSGALLSGHGGMFDAIDSVVPTVFLFHFYITQIWPRIA